MSQGHGRRAEVLLALAGLLAVIGFALGWATADRRADQRDAVSGQAQQLVECVNDPATTLDDCADQADQVQQTIKDEEGQVGPAGADGADGSDGVDGQPGPAPSDGQVALAVQSYCAGGRCEGADGRSVTPGQVAAAVAAYCSSDGRCRGPVGAAGQTGTSGKDGQDGQDGNAGPQGPPPSPEQVAAAVDSYCANGECTGPPGPAGKDGDPGRGVQAVTCDQATERFVVTFTDGTSESVEGSDCVAESLLNP